MAWPGQEQIDLDALAEGGGGEDQAAVGHVQVALGAVNGELAPGRSVVSEVGNDGRRGVVRPAM